MIKMKPLLKESTWADRKFGEPLPTIEDYVTFPMFEADDDNYVHVGGGRYKEKGKEDDKNAPSFTKTDSGKYVKAGDDKKGAKPKKKGKALGKGDFGRDLDDDEDDYDMGVEPTSRGAGGWTPKDRTGDESPEEYRDMIKQQKQIVKDLWNDPDADREDIEDAEMEIDALEGELSELEPSNDIEYHEYEEIRSPLEIEDFLERHGDKLSDEQKDKIHDLGLDLEDAEGEMAMGQISDDEYEEKVSDIQGEISDVVDTTAGDPGDSWDDEEGRAKPTGKTDADTDDDEYAISGTDSDDPAGGKGDAWMTGHDDDDVHQKGMAKARDLAKKGMKKRPGGEQAELDYQKADQMMRKYAGVDIEKAEYWAKKKRQASNAMMGEITINGKKYKPITENIEPTIFNPQEEIKKVWDKIKTRQFDRKWKK
jgi:hypothetical protein